jgi:hypothetical protein
MALSFDPPHKKFESCVHMISRVHFRDRGMKVIADGSKGIFSISQSETGALYLLVQGDVSTLHFLIEYSEDLASAIGKTVEYTNGMVLFTDCATFESTEECPVCYEMYNPPYQSKCGHHCCIECMLKMSQKGLTTCPLCRSSGFL